MKDLLHVFGDIYTIEQTIEYVENNTISDWDGFGELYDVTTKEFKTIQSIENIDYLKERDKEDKYLVIWYNK